jgi:NADPH2:quinone reductase
MGADVVVDPGAGDMVAVVREATGGRGVDVVLDPVGAPLFDAARRCVAIEGRIVVVGFAGGGIPSLPLNRPLLGNYSVSGLYFTPYARRAPDVVAAAHAALLRLYAEGAVRPAIRAEVPFTELPRAFDALRERRRPGRVVLLGSC